MDELDLGQTIRGFAAGQRILNRYSFVRILGRGGMGVVWLARDDELEREVALKFLPELVVHDRAVLDDLKRETVRSLALTHHNIVRIYDFAQGRRVRLHFHGVCRRPHAFFVASGSARESVPRLRR